MQKSFRTIAGAVALAIFVAGATTAHAQDAATSDSETVPTMDGAMTGQGTMGGGYCMPGCVVAPMGGQGMTMGPGMMGQGMMGPGMMNQGQMPMMGYGMMGQGMMGPGMMNQGQMPMMGYGMMGQGMMGQGQMPMMGGMMMDPGMMGQGMMNQGQMPMMGGTMGQGGAYLMHDLSGEDVRHVLEHRLTRIGMPNLTVGAVEEQDADTIVAEVVTKDGTLVQRLSVDRHTGAMTPLE